MTLCVLKDKECTDLRVFNEKEEMALAKNKTIKKTKLTKKTTPNS